jgi:hypothetical protein
MAATSAAAVNALAAFTNAGTVARKFSTVLATGDFGLPAWCPRGSMRLAPSHIRVYAAEVTGRLCQRPHSDDRLVTFEHFRLNVAMPWRRPSDDLLVHSVAWNRSVLHGRAAHSREAVLYDRRLKWLWRHDHFEFPRHARVVIEALTTVVWPNCRTAVSL